MRYASEGQIPHRRGWPGWCSAWPGKPPSCRVRHPNFLRDHLLSLFSVTTARIIQVHEGSQFASTLHRLSLLRLRFDRRLTAGLRIELVDFASQLHQLTQLFEVRYPASEAGGTGTGASCPRCRAPMVGRRLLNHDVKARVAD